MQICNQIWLFTDSHRCKRCRDQTRAWLMLLQFFAKNGAQVFFLSKNRIRTPWNRFPDWYMCIFSLWLSRMMMGWSDLRHSLDEPIALSVISHHVWWRPPSCRTMKSKTGNQWFTRSPSNCFRSFRTGLDVAHHRSSRGNDEEGKDQWTKLFNWISHLKPEERRRSQQTMQHLWKKSPRYFRFYHYFVDFMNSSTDPAEILQKIPSQFEILWDVGESSRWSAIFYNVLIWSRQSCKKRF